MPVCPSRTRQRTTDMRYGSFLQPGGTIGFVAPSFGCTTEPYKTAFQSAQRKFQALGYHTVCGPCCDKDDGIGISTDPRSCGRELNDFFLSEQADVLISCGGGELMCEDLPYVDFEAIKNAPPKLFMGYSDNANLTFLLPVLCDETALYAPCAPTFGMEPWDEAVEDAFHVLTGEELTIHSYALWEKESLKDEDHPTVPYHLTEPRILVSENYRAPFSGRLLGGCLDVISMLVGTRFDKVRAFNERYADEGVLWFFESCDLSVLSIRRALWQMDEAGWFETATGFLFGRPLHFDEPMMGLDRHTAVTGILGKYKVPILMDLDIGHLPPMMPILAGSLGEVTVSGNDITIKQT